MCDFKCSTYKTNHSGKFTVTRDTIKYFKCWYNLNFEKRKLKVSISYKEQ